MFPQDPHPRTRSPWAKDGGYSLDALEASELRYRRLFETAQDGILILDGTTGRIVDVNPFLLDLLDYPFDSIIGLQLWEIGLFHDIAANKAAFRKLQKEEYIRYENHPLRTKGGGVVQVEFVSNVYFVGQQRVIQCNIRDISRRVEFQAAAGSRISVLDNLLANVTKWWSGRNSDKNAPDMKRAAKAQAEETAKGATAANASTAMNPRSRPDTVGRARQSSTGGRGMKTALALFALLWAFPTRSMLARPWWPHVTIRLTWEANAEPDIVTYRIHYIGVQKGKPEPPAYPPAGNGWNTEDTGNVTTWSKSLGTDPEQYWFFLTAINTANMISPPSTPVAYQLNHEKWERTK